MIQFETPSHQQGCLNRVGTAPAVLMRTQVTIIYAHSQDLPFYTKLTYKV